MGQIREMIELPLRHPTLRLGLKEVAEADKTTSKSARNYPGNGRTAQKPQARPAGAKCQVQDVGCEASTWSAALWAARCGERLKRRGKGRFLGRKTHQLQIFQRVFELKSCW